MRRFVTVVIGVVLGIALTLGTMMTTRLQARQVGFPSQLPPPSTANQPSPRLLEIPASRGYVMRSGDFGSSERMYSAPPLIFLKDLKGDGCWLGAYDERNRVVALAVAPAAACQ